MKASAVLVTTLLLAAPGGYGVGDKATDFNLKNTDGKMVSLKSYPKAEGFIVIFTCNHCPYAKMYEQRIIDLHKKYEQAGYPVIAINPNDSVAYPEDSYSSMQKRAEEMKYPFAYLLDPTQEVARTYGALKTPHVYLLNKKQEVVYMGAIDDNPQSAADAKEKYLEKAIEALKAGKKPNPSSTKAIGCGIKWKK